MPGLWHASRQFPAHRQLVAQVVDIGECYMKGSFTSFIVAVLFVMLGASQIQAASSKQVSPHPVGERSVFSERAISERIRPVGRVCVAGQDCGVNGAAGDALAASAGDQTAEVQDISSGRPAEDVYNKSCMACHATGAAGAPKVGVAADWSARIDQGMDTLVEHSIDGIRAMPPRGLCADCTDEELRAVVELMVERSQ